MTNKFFKKQNEYENYFNVLEILGNYYFHNTEGLIYLSIDENELDELLESVKGNQSGLDFLVDTCRDLLFLNNQNQLFDNLLELTNLWSNERNGYPPQLCFVSIFIIAATRMGENSDTIDWRNYYQQVVNLLRLEIQSNTFGEYFRRDFGDRNDSSRQLFKKLSDWISENYGENKNTFKKNIYSDGNEDHQSWVKNQALINRKDLNCLPEFFKDKEFDVDYDGYTGRQFLDAFNLYLNNPQKSRRFSNSLKNFVREIYSSSQEQDDNLRQKITQLLVNQFDSWDGELLTRETREKIVEILHTVQEIDGNLKFSLYFKNEDKRNNKYIENLREEVILNSQNSERFEFEVSDTSEVNYFCSSEVEIYLEDNTIDYKAEGYEDKVSFSFLNKPIKLFKYDEFDTRKYVELKKSEPRNMTDKYLAICSIEMKDELIEWLDSNLNIDQFEISHENNRYFVLKNIRIINNFTVTSSNSYFDIFSISETTSSKIELVGGLKLTNTTFLSGELPNIYLPNELLSNENYKIFVNGQEIENFTNSNLISSNDYITNQDVTDYIVTDNYDQEFQLKFQVTSEVLNPINSEASTIGYNISSSVDGLNFLNYFPEKLTGEERNSGYLAGADLSFDSNIDYEVIAESTFEFMKRHSKVILLGRNMQEVEEFYFDEISYKWVSDLGNRLDSYHLTKEKNDDNQIVIKLIKYPHYNLQFHYFKKAHNVNHLSWIILYSKFGDIEVRQIGEKKPKNADTLDAKSKIWARTLVDLDKSLNNTNITKTTFKKLIGGEVVLEAKPELLDVYINHAKSFYDQDVSNISDENQNSLHFENNLSNQKNTKEETNIEKTYKEFSALAGERLLRYMSLLGSGTVEKLELAILEIAKQYSNFDGKNLSEVIQNTSTSFGGIRNLTIRILENLTFLLHVEFNKNLNRWAICKPGISFLPGIRNRAIITGSRSKNLLKIISELAASNESISVELIDNSTNLKKISENRLDILDTTYRFFSPMTIMIYDFDKIEDLFNLAINLDINPENINELTTYDFVSHLPDINEIILNQSKDSIMFYDKPNKFSDFVFYTNNSREQIVNPFFSQHLGQTFASNCLYKNTHIYKTDYFIYTEREFYNVSRELGYWFELSKLDKSFVYYNKTLQPCGTLIIPSFIKLPQLYNKVLSFSLGLNPINKKLKIDEHNTTPKLDFYFNIPEETVNTLFKEKLKVKVNYVESEEEVVTLMKKDWIN